MSDNTTVKTEYIEIEGTIQLNPIVINCHMYVKNF